jgi:hypothetical protein
MGVPTGELVASLEPTAPSAAPLPDSLSAAFVEREDVTLRSREIAREFAAGDLDAAERATASAIAAHPRSAPCWNDRGAALQRLGRWSETEAAWTQRARVRSGRAGAAPQSRGVRALLPARPRSAFATSSGSDARPRGSTNCWPIAHGREKAK